MIELIKLSVYAIAVAVVCHEATHYLYAWAFHRNPRFRWVGFDEGGFAVDHDAGERLTFEDWLIHAGPLINGVALAVGWAIVIGAWPPLWAWLGWGTYTLVGAPNDLSFREVHDDSVSVGDS